MLLGLHLLQVCHVLRNKLLYSEYLPLYQRLEPELQASMAYPLEELMLARK